MDKRRSKKGILILICAVVLVAAAAVWYFTSFIWVGSAQLRRSETNVDLSGKTISDVGALKGLRGPECMDLRGTGITIADYDQLAAWYPGCRILWDVPFQGSFLENTTQALTLSSLSQGDAAALAYLPDLKTLDASACRDYAQLAALKRSRPELAVTYSVPIGNQTWDGDTTHMELTDGDSQELEERLAWLPALESVHLRGQLPSPEDLSALEGQYTDVSFTWTLELGEQSLERDTESLCLSGWPLSSAEELEALIAYGPGLKSLELLGSGLDSGILLQARESHPQLQLHWDVTVGEKTFSTGATEVDLSNIPMTDIGQVEEILSCFPNLTWADLSHCGISSEELDALNRKLENVRIVWTVPIGKIGELRTDATFFMPYLMGSMVFDKDITELKYCTDMVCIDLGHCGVTHCDFVASMPKMKFLLLADTQISSLEPLRGLNELVYLEVFLTQVKDLSPLEDCPALLDLNICHTRADMSTLVNLTNLERLWTFPADKHLMGQYFADMAMLKEALPNTLVMQSHESTGAGWREHDRYREMRDILGMYYMH